MDGRWFLFAPRNIPQQAAWGTIIFFNVTGEPNSWHSCRPIREDGTFLFESVPPGEADVLVLGEGFATRSEGGASNRINGVLFVSSSLTTPQAFPLVAACHAN